LDQQVGRTVAAVVERPGRARAEDFTELTFDSSDEGLNAPGQIVRLKIEAHDGRRALAVAS
jgi:threonylcarbamoyladenosine tRNA methylthiotransferase MtaB